MGSLSIWHWIIVIGVVLLLFGRGKISELMGDVAQGIKAFKKGMSEDEIAKADPARTDAVKVKQCLLNLLSNASKFTEGGEIRLDVARSAGAIAFRVSDTGIGMTGEQLGRLFQRFTQADETTTRKFGGTGLGLALTRAFADLLGGTVAVDSVFGEGTTFTLTLPASLPERPRTETRPASEG